MALFGQMVIAELSASVRKLALNETRSIEASFLHPGLDTGPVVQGLVRVENELVLKRFAARHVRVVLPPEWNLKFGANVCSKMRQEIEDAASASQESETFAWDGWGRNTEARGSWCLNIQTEHQVTGFGATWSWVLEEIQERSLDYGWAVGGGDQEWARWSGTYGNTLFGLYMFRYWWTHGKCSPELGKSCKLVIHDQARMLWWDSEFHQVLQQQRTWCVKKRLGGRDILIWKPDEVIDDASLSEIDNMEKCHTGKVILPRRWSSFEQMRLIQSRWVGAYKTATRVRARIVAKDIAKGASARRLGTRSKPWTWTMHSCSPFPAHHVVVLKLALYPWVFRTGLQRISSYLKPSTGYEMQVLERPICGAMRSSRAAIRVWLEIKRGQGWWVFLFW